MTPGEVFAGAIIIVVSGAAAAIAAGYYSFFLAVFPEGAFFPIVATLIVFACILLFIRNSGQEFSSFFSKGQEAEYLAFFTLVSAFIYDQCSGRDTICDVLFCRPRDC